MFFQVFFYSWHLFSDPLKIKCSNLQLVEGTPRFSVKVVTFIFMAFCLQMCKHCWYIEHLMSSIEHLVARSGVSGVATNENSRMYGCLQSGFLYCNQGFIFNYFK